MTAPDPRLADLIAAEIARHRLRYGSEDAYNGERWLCTTCPWLVEADTDSRPNATVIQAHANHVAERLKLVVEQHTNGRITELEAAVRKRIQLLREHDGFGAAHADGYMGMNWTAYYEGAYQAQVMAAADLENDLRAALEGEQQ